MDRGASVSREGMFDGLEGVMKPGTREHYEAGSFGFDISLVNSVMDYYINEGFDKVNRFYWGFPPSKTSTSKRRKLYGKLEGFLKRGMQKGFDPNAFLDAMIERLGWEMSPHENQPSKPGMMLDSLVQVLYTLGHNDFRIDLRRFQQGRKKLTMLARELQGSEDRELRATYRGNVEIFGSNSTHCQLLFYGEVNSGSNRAQFNTFDYHGSVGFLGGHPKGCIFNLDTAKPIVYSDGAEYNQFHVSLDNWSWYNYPLNKLRLNVKISNLRSKGFFEQGNIIYLHRGDEVEEVMW